MLRKVYVIAGLLVSLVLGACFSDSPGGTGPDDDPVAATVGMTAQLTFSPTTVTVAVGERVRWQNTSNLPHTVTANASLAANPANVQLPSGAQAFHSGDMQPGSAFTHMFTVPGTYRYVCLPHEASGMLGTVIVTP